MSNEVYVPDNDPGVLAPTHEQALLGCLFADPSCFFEVDEQIDEACFAEEAHRVLYRAIKETVNDGQNVELVPVLDRAGHQVPITYASAVAMCMPTAANVAYYADKVKYQHQEKLLQEAAETILTLAREEGRPLGERLAEAEEQLLELGTEASKGKAFELYEVVSEVYDLIEEKYHNKAHVGLPTGFNDFDRGTGGLLPSTLNILAARPGMGKTALAAQIALTLAEQGKRVVFFSLEMSKQELMFRMVAHYTGINDRDLKSANLDWQRQAPQINQALSVLSELPMTVIDEPKLSSADIMSWTRRLQYKHGVDMVVVDYLQRVSDKIRGRERYEEVSQSVQNAKTLARQLQVPVLMVAQMGRRVEERGNKRPLLSDLRESGDIEQEADMVIFLHREEQYSDNAPEGETELLVGKHRHGPEGVYYLNFDRQSLKFREKKLVPEPGYYSEEDMPF